MANSNRDQVIMALTQLYYETILLLVQEKEKTHCCNSKHMTLWTFFAGSWNKLNDSFSKSSRKHIEAVDPNISHDFYVN